ncbi:restriction endonuclease subunit S [Marinobacter sp. KM021]|uniref:restriction endonuclease subunit S n=1 Tax=Marinobacter sp. KM021 TaxID=3075616 RepID=UPI003D6ADF21
MVPDGWNDLSLGQLYDFKNGLNADKSSYGHGTPFVNVMDIFAADELSAEALRGSVAASEKAIREFSVNYGDILFNRTSETVEEIAYSAVYLDTQPAVFGGFVIRGRPKSRSVDAHYSKYLFKSAPFRRKVIKACQGAVRANIGQKDLAKIEVSLPPLPEQKKIAQILSTWDQAITATERLLENSQQRNKGLMQQLLTGKKRLPGFEGEWDKVQLKKLGKCIRGVSYKPSDICSEVPTKTVRLLRSTNIQNGSLNDKDLVILPNASVKSEQLLKAGDLCICMANGSKKLVGKSAVFHDSERPYTVGAFCAIYRTFKTADSRFVRFLFESSKYEQQISVILAGSSINNLKGSDIESMWFNAPVDPEEQTAIADVLSSASREIRLLANCLNKFKEEKKALMQQLLTGKRRVQVEAA